MTHSSIRAKFSPVILEIALESQKEVDVLYALLNYAPIGDAAGKAGLSGLEEARYSLEEHSTPSGRDQAFGIVSKFFKESGNK